MKINPVKSVKAGFSLVEMLVVIAVIGIIAAIAVPNIGRINDSAKDATYRRNAQNLASVFASAQAAGYDFSKTGGTGANLANEAAVITALITGATINNTSSPFNGAFFGVPGLKVADATSETLGAAKYLTYTAASNSLLYTGGQ
jgi:prepilin-type N-terminal cleavage/methylation domain-containing protein